MLVLGVDTALGAVSCALVEDGVCLVRRQSVMSRGQQEAIAGLVRDAFAAGGRSYAAVGRVGVIVGPGSFTGLRVGLAFAKGFALGLDRPCVGVDAFAAFHAGALADPTPPGVTAVILDAGRGRLHAALFGAGGERGAPQTLDPQELAALLRTLPSGARVLGPAADRVEAPAWARVEVIPFPDPYAVAVLAASAAPPLAPAVPLYLRAPDARTIAERRGP